MKQVVPMIRIVQKILGMQKIDTGAPYRLSAHCMCVEQPEGLLLYHTMTGELLLLTREEAALLEALPGFVSPALAELIEHWFLRPVGTDDVALADQTREIAKRLRKVEPAVTKYAIFTTTACNARCFYCFEAGWQTSTMTEQIARDTAKYIIAHRGGRPVHIKWFGGEPLVNIRAIDVITDCLRQEGVEFHSVVTSNGYLFDEALVRRVRNDWNLESLQITLDGTEEVYNQRKAYVNPEGSPYRRVLRNIGLLLDAGVSVNVRLNMDGNNEQDMYELVDELAKRFAGKRGFDVYPTLIWEETGIDPHTYTEQERCSYAQKRQHLLAYVEQKGIAVKESLKRKFAVEACSADSGRVTTVMPDGRLGRCTTRREGVIWGSIYSDEVDAEVIRQWKELKPPEASCKTCVAYPQCLRLKKCPIWVEHCSPIERSFREDKIRRAVVEAYKEWKTAGGK